MDSQAEQVWGDGLLWTDAIVPSNEDTWLDGVFWTDVSWARGVFWTDASWSRGVFWTDGTFETDSSEVDIAVCDPD